jgi:signal transduction histidine kinase
MIGVEGEERALRDTMLRLRVLSDASGLLATSLDDDEVLGRLVDILARDVATFCVIDVCEQGRVRRKAVGVNASERSELAGELAGFELDWSRPHPGHEAIGAGRSILVPETTDDFLVAMSQGPEHLELLRRLELRSMVTVPLIGRDRVVGALTLLSSTPERHYGPRDLSFANELAKRTALAIENARLYREARKAIAARENFMAIVSHDLRNPLTTILMTTDLLLRDVPNDRRRRTRKHAETVQRSAARMDRLIRDLLDFASVEDGRLIIDRKPHAARDLAREAIDAQEGQAAAKGLRLTLHCPPGELAILCDRERLQQVFANLIDNAMKFTGTGGSIAVSVERRDDLVAFTIADTGPGIAQLELPHVFERFWQARGTARLGTGLGLSIAKGIVESHGGKIWATSQVGRGSTFTFTCPIAPPRDAPAKIVAEPPAVRGKLVLLVDDDDDVRRALRPIIELQGHAVIEATNGAEALQRLRSEPLPQLILLDLQMPVMDGWSLLAERNRDPLLRAIPVIVVSAHDDVERRVSAARASYVRKPFLPSSLVATIESLAC